MDKQTQLTSRERLFCQNYVRMGNAREAAARSGFPLFPERSGIRLLDLERVREEVGRLQRREERTAHSRTVAGYERLAYGGISDAVRLLFSENVNAEELETMDLFNVSEIKKPREGCLEIKFFDRLKALEKLEQISDGVREKKSDFLCALEQGALMLNTEEVGDGHGV